MGGGDRLTKLETRLETVLPTLATKADVAEAKATIVMWVAGVIAASTAIIISVLAFMLNRAVPPQQPSASQAPVIVYPATPPAAPVAQPPSSKRGQ